MPERLYAVVGTDAHALQVASSIITAWDDVGISGEFLARNLTTGEQLGFGTGELMPLASIAKVPLALVILDDVATGALDPARAFTIDPASSSFGATGVAAFRYPVRISLHDLTYQMLAVSDNAAGDALLDLIGVDQVNSRLVDWGIDDIRFRHRFQTMYDCAVGVAGHDFRLALDLAVEGDANGHHRIDSLDSTRSNVGTAAALVDLLDRIWSDRIGHPDATAELRDLMARQPPSHRLSSDLQADDFEVAAKTGTFLNLRHEIGVVGIRGGDRIAIVALTRSSQRGLVQQPADLAIGAAARAAVETLRT